MDPKEWYNFLEQPIPGTPEWQKSLGADFPPDEMQQAQKAREAATLRTRQAAQPAGGRGEGGLSEFIRQNTPIASPLVGMFESYKQGDYPGMAAEAGSLAFQAGAGPIIGNVIRGAGTTIGAATRAFPKTSATLGATGLVGATTSTTSESAAKLNRAQQQEVQMKQQEIAAKAEAERQAIEARSKAAQEEGKTKAAAEQERLRLESEIRQKEEKEKREAIAAQEEKASRERAAEELEAKSQTFRQKWGTGAYVAELMGVGMAFGVPRWTRGVQKAELKELYSKWTNAVAKSDKVKEDLLKAGESTAKTNAIFKQYKDELEGLAKDEEKMLARHQKELGVKTWKWAAAPLTGAMLPDILTMVAGSPEARARIMEEYKHPDTYLRFAAAPLGIAETAAGAHFKIKQPLSPRPESEALSGFKFPAKPRATQQTTKRKKPAEKAESSEISPDTPLDQAARIMMKNQENVTALKRAKE